MIFKGLVSEDGEDDLKKSIGVSASRSAGDGFVALEQKLATKEMELADLTSRHSIVVSEKDLIEGQLKAMQEQAEEAKNKLSELKVCVVWTVV